MDKETIARLKNIIITAGNMSLALREQGLKVRVKDDGSFVTNADIALSDFIFRALEKIDKKIPIICEERDAANLSEITGCPYFWLVDPIDGTRGFIQNAAEFTVNIALIEASYAKYGFLYVPSQSKLYYTDESLRFNIEEGGCLVENTYATPMPESSGYTALVGSRCKSQTIKNYLQNYSVKDTLFIASSLKLAMIAEGAGDIYPRFSQTMEWDIAAGHALIKANNGNIFDNHASEMRYGKNDFLNEGFLAMSSKLLQEAQENNLGAHFIW
jgi:3'(2'), 5'-bisphosphate nucleotidase